MAFRDIFDADPRSKDKLRTELQGCRTETENLSKKLDQLHAANVVQEMKIADLTTQIEAANREVIESKQKASDLELTQSGLQAELQDLQYKLAETENRCVAERTANVDALIKVKQERDELERDRDIQRTIADPGARNEQPNGIGELILQKAIEWTPAELAQLEQRESLVFRNFAELQRRENLVEQDEKRIAIERQRLDNRKSIEISRLEGQVSQLEADLARERGKIEALHSANEQATELQQKIVELQKKLDTAEVEVGHLKNGTGTEQWQLKRDLENCRKELQWKSGEIISRDRRIQQLRAEADAAKLKLPNLQQDLVNCQAALIRLQRTAAPLKQQLEDARSQLTTLQEVEAEKKRLAAQLTQQMKRAAGLENQLSFLSAYLATFRNEKILSWVFSETTPESLNVNHGYLHLMGHGPWGLDELGRLMEAQEFSLWKLPDQDIEHIVVGREDWDAGKLVEQIAMRQGQELRIYPYNLDAQHRTLRDRSRSTGIVGHDRRNTQLAPQFDRSIQVEQAILRRRLLKRVGLL